MDRRLIPATERVAHISLQGRLNAPTYTKGQSLRVAMPLVDLLRKPGGARERQLLLGAGFTVVDRADGHAFGFAQRDGYCGWLPETALTDTPMPSHWVATPGTHLYPEPKVQARELSALSLGAQVHVLGQKGAFYETSQGFVPVPHLRLIAHHHSDPVTVAEGFLGVPYLWGGNSRAGIDCSGLAQVAHHACGIAAPGDSDLQESMGQALSTDAFLARGDLIFWRGHIALIVDDTRLIHANGHTMSVAYEDTAACIARIDAQGGGPVTHRRRL